MNVFSRLKNPVIIGGIATLFAITFLKFIPFNLQALTTAHCRPDTVNPSFVACDVVNNGWSIVEFVAGVVGMHGIPFAIGITFGLMTMRNATTSLKDVFFDFLIAMLTFIVFMAVFELLWYRPWISQPYNRYVLNAVYGSPFAVLLFFIGVIGFFIAAIIVFFKKPKKSIVSG